MKTANEAIIGLDSNSSNQLLGQHSMDWTRTVQKQSAAWTGTVSSKLSAPCQWKYYLQQMKPGGTSLQLFARERATENI